MDPLSRNPLSSFSRRIPRLRQPSRLTTRVLHPSARIKADILARRPARQPPPCAPPHGTPRTPRCTPPCTPVTALCRLARAIHHSARCPAVPLARRASRPSCAAPRIPRMPHRTALRAIRRPTHHPAPPVTARQGRRPRPASPGTTRHIRTSRTNVSRETFRPQILSARHPQSRSAPCPPHPHERNPPEWRKGRCDSCRSAPCETFPYAIRQRPKARNGATPNPSARHAERGPKRTAPAAARTRAKRQPSRR